MRRSRPTPTGRWCLPNQRSGESIAVVLAAARLIFLSALLVAVLAACSRPPAQGYPSPSGGPVTPAIVTPEPFVLDARPAGDAVVGTTDLAGQICLVLDAVPLVQPGERLFLAQMQSRSRLAVDGRELPLATVEEVANLIILTLDGQRTELSGPFTFCWAAGLGAGEHTAVYTYTPPDGQAESYRWSFTVTD